MIYIYKDRIVHIEWTILKGTSTVEEDFSRAQVWCFLIGRKNRIPVSAVADMGTLKMDVPQGLPEGAYSLEAIYVKNADGLAGCGTDSRCIMRSRKDCLFAITEYEREATGIGEGEVVLKLKTSVATYGYDGLSAYEIAVLRGDWYGDEESWVKSRLGVTLYGEKGDSETHGMSQQAITRELDSLQRQINAINLRELDITVDVTPDVIYRGENTPVTVTASLGKVKAERVSILKGTETIAEGTDTNLLAQTVYLNGDTGFTAEAEVFGLSVRKTANVYSAYPCYVGAGETYRDVVTDGCRQSPRISMKGTYDISVAEDGHKVFFCCPQGIDIVKAVMGGFEFPLAKSEKIISSKVYNVYESRNTYAVGVLPIVIS